MLILGIFVLELLVATLAWFGQRQLALGLFSITLILACICFNHHLTSHLNIQL